MVAEGPQVPRRRQARRRRAHRGRRGRPALRRLAFEWRAPNFVPGEKTFVEVLFEESASGTLVVVTHAGWSAIRPDHPARHGEESAEFLRRMGLWWGDQMTSLRVQAEHAVA